jgi:hypothetical protein
MSINFEVSWSGSYPNLCSGSWTIKVDGVNLPIPNQLIRNHMNTRKTYQTWHFEDWSEVFEDYEDGDEFGSWLANNASWLEIAFIKIGKKEKVTLLDLENLYDMIKEHDWRHNSCGGCV